MPACPVTCPKVRRELRKAVAEGRWTANGKIVIPDSDERQRGTPSKTTGSQTPVRKEAINGREKQQRYVETSTRYLGDAPETPTRITDYESEWTERSTAISDERYERGPETPSRKTPDAVSTTPGTKTPSRKTPDVVSTTPGTKTPVTTRGTPADGISEASSAVPSARDRQEVGTTPTGTPIRTPVASTPAAASSKRSRAPYAKSPGTPRDDSDRDRREHRTDGVEATSGDRDVVSGPSVRGEERSSDGPEESYADWPHDPCEQTCPLIGDRERAKRRLEEKQRIVDHYYLTKGFRYFDDVCTCSLSCVVHSLGRDRFVQSILTSAALFAIGVKLCSELNAWYVPGRVV